MAKDNSAAGDVRSSALWGTGNRGGEHRSSALWGRGGRGIATGLVVAFALMAPFAALAGGGKGSSDGNAQGTFVAPGLVDKAKANGDQKLRVIITSSQGVGVAESAFGQARGGDTGDGKLGKRLSLVDGVAVELKAKKLAKLAQIPGLTITADAPVKLSGSLTYSKQLWPYESGNAQLWPQGQTTLNTPTIAIVDSGLDSAARADFGSRAYPQVNLSTLTPNATGDGRGHGTFVAGIAAGNAPGLAGASPTSRILPIRVMDDHGMAMTSDVINAAAWILANKDAYNISVANFSLHSSAKNHFYNDPLDRAVEKLWFGGITVVAAAGNYGTAGTPSGVLYAPGNDPFVITVGAVDLGNSIKPNDDFAAPWSAYGRTEDGFAKPEVGAPGRYIIGPVPAGSTLASERPGNVVSPGYMQLSGTSFSAPVVSGTVAQMLALHPSWTPDQVKGALMLTAKKAPNAAPGSIGVGEIVAGRAATSRATPNPNAALDGFVKADPVAGTVFDAASWTAAVQTNASWAAASWTDASWAAASWSAASWADASWSAASWADASWAAASWADASWAAASWADTSTEDAAEGDANGTGGEVLDPADVVELQADPALAVPNDVLPDALVTLTGDPNVTSTISTTGTTSTTTAPLGGTALPSLP